MMNFSRTYYKCCLFCLCSLFSLLNTNAQHTLQGVVTDAANGQPLEMVTVQLLRGSDEKLINYALTDADGRFSIKAVQTSDSLQIAISLLGYKAIKQTITSAEKLDFRMEQQAFSLREVEIRPGRVWGSRDTINYDVTQFLSGKDETIKDVIKKLPGVNVDELGRITYNGKDISNFYVEGMDLTDGRYSQIANNLDAKAVEKVQLLENHQPIRILQDKITTENVAMNLKLKPEFRAKWMFTVQGGIGASPLLWDGWLNAMQLSRNSQSAYVYKGNNRGIDVTDENIQMFINQAGKLPEPNLPSFLSQPSIMAPLKKERLLFNDTHSLTANRLYRLNETTQLRINAGYVHDERKQTRGSETSYFQQDDTIRITEQSNSAIRSDNAELTLNLENNDTDKFLTNKLKMAGGWNNSTTRFTGKANVLQKIETPDLNIRNEFKNLWERKDYTYEARSLLSYNHQPAKLFVNDDKQEINLNYLYTDNSFSVLRKTGYLTQQYSGGLTGQFNTIGNGFSLYAYPSWQWNKGKWQTRFAAPVTWTNYPGNDFSRLSANPSLNLSYKYNYAWRFSVSASYREQYADILNFRSAPYRTDYRNSVMNSGSLPVMRLQNYSLYGEYKNTINEFFATLSLNHSRTWRDHIYEQVIENDHITLISQKLSNHAESWAVRGTLSKGFYELGMKASLDYRLSKNKAEQLSKGEKMPYESNALQVEPKLSWTPSKHIETSYEANINYRESKIGDATRLTPLWSVVQKLNLSYNLFPIEINVSGDHYYNDISPAKSVHAYLADFSLRWKFSDWQIAASVNNIFDKQQYSYTEYSSIQSYTSWIDIRGREYFISARYRF